MSLIVDATNFSNAEERRINDPYGRTVVNYGVQDMAFNVKNACDKVEQTIVNLKSWVGAYLPVGMMGGSMIGGRWIGDDLNAISHGSKAQFNLTKDHMFHQQYKMFIDREKNRLKRAGFQLASDAVDNLLDSFKRAEVAVLNAYRFITRAADGAESGQFKDKPAKLQNKVAKEFQHALSKYRRKALKFLPIIAAMSKAADNAEGDDDETLEVTDNPAGDLAKLE